MRFLVLCNVPYLHGDTWYITFLQVVTSLCFFPSIWWGFVLWAGFFVLGLFFWWKTHLYSLDPVSLFSYKFLTSQPLLPYSFDPMTSQKTYFWPWLFIVLIILNLWCFIFVQAFGNTLKQNLVADLGSFQKSICKCVLRCGIRLELGVLKLCEGVRFLWCFKGVHSSSLCCLLSLTWH